MSEVAELIVLPPQETALAVYQELKGLDPYLERIRQEVAGHVPDVSSRKGREAIASLAFKVRKSKTALDNLGKQLVDDLKEIPKKIDAERKRMRDTLDALADEVRKPLTDWESAEADRIANHRGRIDGFNALAERARDMTSDELRVAIQDVDGWIVDESWEEFEAEAHRAKARALDALTAALAVREKQEAEQAELARLRAEAAVREQREREERIAHEAAEAARIEAERRALAEREKFMRQQAEAAEMQRRAERDRQDAIDRQKQAEARAEAERLAAEKRAADAAEAARSAEIKRQQEEREREAQEQRKREADKAHRARVNRAAMEAFVAAGFHADQANGIVSMIARGAVPGVTINY